MVATWAGVLVDEKRTSAPADDGVNGAPNVLQNVTSALAKQKSAEKSI